ncbi:MAG TPA: hypothetical protein VM580_18225 [Labilithrix sp.]|jgi:hypothetical protein|nr:hypothetical protein [Labilithrix sp.]
MPGALYWIDAFARSRGLRYEPEADERWLRAWEPYTTLKVPFRYEHALHATGVNGSLSIARAVLELPRPSAPPPGAAYEVGTWIAIVQDVRITTKAALTSDFGSPFAEPLELVSMQRLPTGEAAFDHVFASFAGSPEDLATAITPSVRKLLLSWRVPVHAETRPGGFILAPVTLSADDRGVGWLFDAIHVFGEKATKRRT